jgi:hypothetical protein
MSYEIRKLIEKVKNWKQFLNKNDSTTREIIHILSENGFIIQDIYDVENIKGIDSMILTEKLPVYVI